MRIVLIYPPPWRIPAAGQSLETLADGPPEGFRATDVDVDFFQAPYGLLTLAAQAMRAGHQVKVLNLSNFPWLRVEQVIEQLPADLFGLSCFTANRRGVALVASCIRRHHPKSHIVAGGAHATALPVELLEHYAALDTVVLGEGELTFLELIERLASGQPVTAIEGTAYRDGGRVRLAPPRARIPDLDRLASPHDYFATHLFMTSRGCPSRCTFCAKNVVWGSKYRTHSVDYVLNSLTSALERLPLKMLLVKDDTFTANRQRALEICAGIKERGLDFIWSCDTRADALDEELARALRLAGCQRLSLGVESGSPVILQKINKRVAPETMLEATQTAKQVGLQVRYFMMLGNRGETAETFSQSLRFIEQAQPHQSIFACLSVYPGTQDFEDLQAAGVLDPEVYFTEDFQELKVPFDASEEDTRLMSEWFFAHLVAAGQLDAAEQHLLRALELGYPVPELVHNTLACVAAARGDPASMQKWLSQAMRGAPHRAIVRNVQALSGWRAGGGPRQTSMPKLEASHEFELPEPTVQPMLPGPIPAGFERWE
jgi:anaerobic magnesium-protoporphyrin IX monomethyl ester cyclase